MHQSFGSTRRALTLTALIAATGLIVACGGGSESSAPIAEQEPLSVAWGGAVALANIGPATEAGTPMTIIEPPLNGVVTVEDGVLIYRPAAGYFGSDRVVWEQIDMGDVEPRRQVVALAVTATLRLEGTAGDTAMPGMAVEVQVGARSERRIADADGRWSADIRTADPQELISITIDNGSGVRLVRLAGSTAAMASAADVEGRVAAGTMAALVPDARSTALAAVLSALNAGALPEQQSTLQALQPQVEAAAVERGAVAVASVLTGAEALQPGVANTFVLAGVMAAVQAPPRTPQP